MPLNLVNDTHHYFAHTAHA